MIHFVLHCVPYRDIIVSDSCC